MSKIFISLLLCFVSGVALTGAAFAKNDTAAPPGQHLNITGAFVIFGVPDTVMITGTDFDFGSPLKVTLGEMGELAIVSADGSEIIAELPAGLPDGDYLLTVSTGRGQSLGDEYDLTIGAVGPVGPQGPPGNDGVDGQDGAPGTQGPPGNDGVDGQDGAPGAQGPPGVSGYERVFENLSLGPDGSAADFQISCPAGKRILSAGQFSSDGFKRLDVWRSGPISAQTWLFTYTVEPGGADRGVTFLAICATVL